MKNQNSHKQGDKVFTHTKAAIPGMIQVKTYGWHRKVKLPGAGNMMNEQEKHAADKFISLEKSSICLFKWFQLLIHIKDYFELCFNSIAKTNCFREQTSTFPTSA